MRVAECAKPFESWADLRVILGTSGATHSESAAYARRDRELGRRGWRVLRLPAELVARDAAEAVRRVRAALGGGG